MKFSQVENIKLPGLIDVHTHLREPGGIQKEDFETGTKAAIAGGYTLILDMPNNIPPTITSRDLSNKEKLAKGRIYCDVGFNFGATSSSVKYFKKIKSRVFGLKVYMNQTTGTLLVDKQTEREVIFKSWTSPLPIMTHSEGETVLEAISLAKKYKKALHICHISLDQLKYISQARIGGLQITCEVCPHHLFLNREDQKRLGPLGVMKPQLLSKQDQEKLWDNIDKIDMISTDHAPHTLNEKYDQTSPKFGVPGLETTLPLMLNAAHKKWITVEKLVKMLSTNPRKIFKIPIQPKTYVLVDTSKTYKISSKKLYTKCAWTPFGDLEGKGEIKRVVIRGKTVFQNGVFFSKPSGLVIYPNR